MSTTLTTRPTGVGVGTKRTAAVLEDDSLLTQEMPSSDDHRFGVALRTLDIQGFRSFGAPASDVAHIDWMSPVTLILGPNGTGKTTIIECLKFATTGEVPPNSNRGSAFVHDPKLSHESQVRGQVALRFFGADNKEYLLTRTVEGKLAKGAKGHHDVKFKTLETTLHKYVDGKKQITPLTVDQAGQTIQRILGVSKPIINSVIFCHQEESDWPLDQGAKLKDKFDEIFSATKYIKALEEFRELKKRDKVELRAAEEKKEDKRVRYKEAEAKRIDLEAAKVEAEGLEKSLTELKEKKKELEIKQLEVTGKLNEAAKLEKQSDKLKMQMETIKAKVADLEKRLGQEYEKSTDELREEIKSSKDVVGEQKKTLDRGKKRSTELDKKLVDLRKKASANSTEIGTYTVLAQQHEKMGKERDALLKQLAQTFGMKMYMDNPEYMPGEVESFGKDFAEIVAQAEDELRKQKAAGDEEMEGITQNIMSKKQELENLQKTMIKIRKDSRDKTTKKENIQLELDEMGSHSNKLNVLEGKIAAHEASVEQARGEVNVDELKTKIGADSDRKKAANDQLKTLKDIVKKKESQQDLNTKIEMLEKQKTEKKELVEKQRSKLQPFLDRIGDNVANEELKGRVDRETKESTKAADKAKKAVGETETKIALKDQERASLKKDIEKTESKIKTIEEELEKLTSAGGVDIHQSLSKLDEEIQQQQKELAEWQGKTHVLKGYREILLKKDVDKPCCPTCHRGFAEPAEATELAEELENTLKEVPTLISTLQAKIALRHEKRDKIVAFVPEAKKLENLKKTDTDLKAKLKKIVEDAITLRKEKEDLETTAEVSGRLQQVCSSSQPDALKLDGLLNDLKKIEKEMTTLSNKLDKTADPRTLEVIKGEKEALEGEIEKIEEVLEKDRSALSKHEEKLNKLKNELNTFRDQKLKISEKLQERLKMEHQITELTTEIDNAEKEVTDLTTKEPPLKTSIETFTVHRQMVQARIVEDLKEYETKVSTSKDGQKELGKFAFKEKEYERKDIGNKLKTAQEDAESIKTDIAAKEADVTALKEELRKTEKDLDNVATRDQTLQDNLALRERREDLSKHQHTFDELTKQIDTFKTSELRDEHKVQSDSLNKCSEELFKAQGRSSELTRTINSRQKELEVDYYKNANKYHSEAVQKCKVLDLAMKDVDKFYKALDYAVMKFHSAKMEEINKILRDLWQSTYQGNDIDYIEIRSDADESSIEGEKSKRNHNYRVVMVSGDTALDMRGRCSAGQRVLACLIIRLALAEAFALNCGILALDEPTTNLDRDNIEHLAKSLSRLIRTREYEQQRHRFQLIIITHDADFLNILNTANTGPLVDFYYKIYKDNDGKSRLERKPYLGHF